MTASRQGSVDRILVLGCGYTGAAVARLARERGLSVLTHVRSDERATALRDEGFEVLQRAMLEPNDAALATAVTPSTHVVVAFPPDGTTDAAIAPLLGRAAALTYVSSTGVYGELRGVIDDTTPLPDPPSARATKIVDAETAYRAAGAGVLRCPGIYGPDRGLHMRVVRGEHRIPGDGTRYLSRIHVVDLAQIILASSAQRDATMVVGDREPARQIDVVRFICASWGVPMPPSVPLESVHESLRADRRVDASRVLAQTRVVLAYPTYREGMAKPADQVGAP